MFKKIPPASIPYITECSAPAGGLYLVPESFSPAVFTFEHQPCPHNRWLQYSVSLIGHGSLSQTHICIVIHTPVTLTPREKRWASAGQGCASEPLHPPFLPHLPTCLQGAQVSQSPPETTEEGHSSMWAFEPRKIQPLPRPLSPTRPSSRSRHSLTSDTFSLVGAGVGG